MKKIQILTQANCSKCNALKQFLEQAIGEPYVSAIEWVHKEKNASLFESLKEKHNVLTTPVLIIDEHVLLNTTPSHVSQFLRDYA